MRRRDVLKLGLAGAAGSIAGRADALTAHQRTLLGGSGYSFANSQAATVAAAFTTPPTNARKRLIDNLVGSLKSASIWASLDNLYMLAAADSQAARVNWKNPGTFTALAVNSPTFEADRGYTGDAASSRLRTQYTPSTNGSALTQNSASAWVWSRTDGAIATDEIGNITAPRIFVGVRIATSQYQHGNNDGTINNVNGSTSGIGFFGTSRADSANKTFWKDGASVGTQAVASTAVASQEQWICGLNSTVFSPRQLSVAAWGDSLATKEAAFYSAILTYMQAVGAA